MYAESSYISVLFLFFIFGGTIVMDPLLRTIFSITLRVRLLKSTTVITDSHHKLAGLLFVGNLENVLAKVGNFDV